MFYMNSFFTNRQLRCAALYKISKIIFHPQSSDTKCVHLTAAAAKTKSLIFLLLAEHHIKKDQEVQTVSSKVVEELQLLSLHNSSASC